MSKKGKKKNDIQNLFIRKKGALLRAKFFDKLELQNFEDGSNYYQTAIAVLL